MRLLAVVLCLVLALPASLPAGDDKKKAKDDVEKIGDRDVDGSVNLYSIEKEIALGKQYADEIVRQSRIVDDPIVAEYVNRIGQNLVRHSDAEVPFTFQVIDSPDINAFALPGGYCFVNTGLLLEAETEAEMAGVLAHEIAHVAARHGTRQATRGQIANMATIPVAILTGGWGGFAARQAMGLLIPVAFMEFSRGFEREADYLGLQYLFAAGYDPTAFVDFFEKLAAKEKTKPGSLASVFRSHPMTDDRIEAAQAEMEEILPSKPEYLVSTSEFLKVQERLSGQLQAREKGDSSNRPQVRRRGTVIKPEPEEPAGGGAEEDTPPVLKRQ